MSINRQKLTEMKRVARKMDFRPDTQLVHALIDSNLDLLDQIEGGASVQQKEQALRERENSVKDALLDLQEILRPDGYDHSLNEGYANKVRFTVELILKMLRSGKTKDFQSWKDWRVVIDEEFGV